MKKKLFNLDQLVSITLHDKAKCYYLNYVEFKKGNFWRADRPEGFADLMSFTEHVYC